MDGDESITSVLERQYFDPSHEAGFAGAQNLIRLNSRNIKPSEIKKWLERHDTYTLHKPVRRKFPRLCYNVSHLDQVWELDLQDLRSLKTYNDDVAYILVAIDVLSKYVWVEPLKDKSTREVANAFDKILKRSGTRYPHMVQTDRGLEFLGNEMQKLLKDKDILFRVARSPDVKAAVVERVNRTLKQRMWRYFSYKNTHRYVDVLQKIVDAYNNTRHSSIKMKPSEVNEKNFKIARKNLEKICRRNMPNRKKPKYSVGDYVRISREKNAFDKGYVRGWQEEIFKVKRVIRRQSIFIYELTDLQGEEIEGFFYPEELGSVDPSRVEPDKEFTIDRIISTRGKGKRKQYLVSWTGYPDKFNSWIPASDLKTL